MFKHMLQLPSSPLAIERVELFVQDLASKYALSHEKYPNVLISLTEAVNNAICHGNQYDENKFVNIAIMDTAEGFAIRVSDEGIGFNPINVPDPTTKENISKLGGRGVFLIKELADTVNFLNEGRTVEMYFEL